LLTRFKDENIFRQVIEALLELDHGTSPRERRRAHHRVLDFYIEDGRLWKLGPKTVRGRDRVECVTKAEAMELARTAHMQHSHFHCELIKIQLLNSIYSPALDQSIVRVITECGQCKNFGAKHLQSLLEPITCRHPFELMVSDTLSKPPGMGGPIGSGGFHKLALEMATYPQRLWAKLLISAASGKTTVTHLRKLWTDFQAPETYMCDNGLEFDNWQLCKLCEEFSVELHFVAAYSPWVNGLVEGTNAKILGRLTSGKCNLSGTSWRVLADLACMARMAPDCQIARPARILPECIYQ
jgi:hypothetical protein